MTFTSKTTILMHGYLLEGLYALTSSPTVEQRGCDSSSLFHRWTIQRLKRLNVSLGVTHSGIDGFGIHIHWIPKLRFFFFFHNEESLQVGELVTPGTRERAFNSILYKNRKKNSRVDWASRLIKGTYTANYLYQSNTQGWVQVWW